MSTDAIARILGDDGGGKVEIVAGPDARRGYRFNPHHDAHGKFSSGGAGGPGSGLDLMDDGSAHFDSSAAFQAAQESVPGKEDKGLLAIMHRQGFGGPPTVVSREDFDRSVAAGEVTETFRGLNGGQPGQYAEQMRSGPVFAKGGFYGAGIYVARGRGHAEDFAGPGGEVVRVGLHKDARVVQYDQLKAEMGDYMARHSSTTKELERLDKEMHAEVLKVDDDTPARIATYAKYERLKSQAAGPEYMLAQDEGRFAAMRGYDAIDVPNGWDGPQLVILNRTALLMEAA